MFSFRIRTVLFGLLVAVVAMSLLVDQAKATLMLRVTDEEGSSITKVDLDGDGQVMYFTLTCCRHVGGCETWETRLSISSHRPRAKFLAIRKHWGIENTQHWSLDVTFGEDVRRQQDRHGAANLAAVRRLALSLLRQEKTNKRGLKNKRLACALDPKYLLKVLADAQF